jgi:formylmethanofuran dehydrogenase subunit D
MGVTPALKDAVFARLENELGVVLPTWVGMDTLSCVQAAHGGKIRAAWCLGGNLYGSNPDATFAHEAMSRIDQVVYLSTTLNTGHAWGLGREAIILPVLARDEERQATTQESMFNFVRVSAGAAGERPRYEGPRSEVDVIATVAQAVLGDPPRSPVDWRGITDHTRIRQLIASIIPGYEAIGEMDRTKREFHVAGRVLHERRFPTPSGRAKMHAVELPPLLGGGPTFRLATIRSEGQFNTVVYEDEDVYRGQERRDVILMNPGDLTALGVADDSLVEVRGAAGAMRVRARRFDVPVGNCAMYYPEANVLIPRTADPLSHTPAFKSAVVTVRRIVAALLVALALGGTGLQAQRVTGVVTNARTAQPLPGVVVSLLNASGVSVAQTLTDRAGIYRIAVDSSARRVLIRRIGFGLVDRPLPAAAHVSVATLDVAMDVIPVDLPPVLSNAAGCRPSRNAPQALALLEQARFGFLATVVARDANRAEAKLIRYRRTMVGAILLDERVEVGTGTFDRPFVASLEPEALVAHGFTTQLVTGKRFHAPDPDLLLSGAFLATHCFDVAPANGNHRGEVGIAFAPALGRDSLIEVSGTIWMTRDPLALKSLEFRYVHLPSGERNANAGGTLMFRAAANGVVVVSEWHLTIPPLPGRSLALAPVTVTQSGGVVAWATWPDGTSLATPLASVSGRVIDEKTRKGVADMRVAIPGTPFRTVSGANGVFRIDSVLPGPHEIWIADDSSWRAFGIARSRPVPVRATVARASPIEMQWLDADRLTQLQCDRFGRSQGVARLLGKVVDSAGRTLRATVTLAMPTGEAATIRTAPGTSRTATVMRPAFPLTTGTDGLFAYCGLMDQPITLTARLPDGRSAVETVTPSDRDVTRVTVTIRN